MMRKIQYIFCFIFFSFVLNAQDLDTIPDAPSNMQDLIETFIISNEGDNGEFDLNDFLDDLEFYKKRPLNLNKANREDLEEFRLLTTIQINNLLNYRETAGELIAIQELQTIPSFDDESVQRILPYVTVGRDIDDYNIPLWEAMYKGSNEVYLRYRRTLEEKKGYIKDDRGESKYSGNPDNIYIRFNHKYENRVSYGITLEKDAGEELFSGVNAQQGFDYISAHLFLKDYNQTFKAVAIGDYSINMGQGLLAYQGFGGNKSADAINIKRTARTLRKYTSLGEYAFLRGAAATIRINENIEFTGLASYRNIDLNFDVDTIREDPNNFESDIIGFATSFTEEGATGESPFLLDDGLHRTESEIRRKNSASLLTTGAVLRYSKDNWHIAANVLYNKTSEPLLASEQLYKKFSFSGDQLINGSIDYSYVKGNFNFFGEAAISDSGGKAFMNGLIVGLDRTASLAIAHRYVERNYHGFFMNYLSETSKANENGVYLGLEVKPNKKWTVNAYFDAWKHPWMTFYSDRPSSGLEYFGRLTYYRKRRMRIYVQVRDEFKQRSGRDTEPQVDYTITRRKTAARVHFDNKISKALELRNRVEFTFFKNGSEATQNGFLVYQDVLYKPLAPLHFTARFAIFQMDDWENRAYAYENDILNSFYIPPYYNKGTRFYINLRYKGIRNMTAELRFAQTYFANVGTLDDNGDVITFGSGNEQIDGKVRTEVKAQIKYKF